MIKMIAALANNNVIGLNNQLPWKLPKDMKFFAEQTTNHTVIMGRKSWDSIPAKYRPLPNRRNIVISRQNLQIENVEVYNTIEAAIKAALGTTIFIIGGAEIYNLALPYANQLILTEVNAEVAGDTYFPKFDKSKYTEISRIKNQKDEKHAFDFDFVTYQTNS